MPKTNNQNGHVNNTSETGDVVVQNKPNIFIIPTTATFETLNLKIKNQTHRDNSFTFELEANNEKASIYYGIDNNSFVKYDGPVILKYNCVVKAYAELVDIKSEILEEHIDLFKVASPKIVQTGRTVIIQSDTSDCQIYYTTDGKNPSVSSSLYKGEFDVKRSCVIKAIATKTKWENSDVVFEQISIVPTKEERVRVFTNESKIIGISYRGDSHIKSDVVCQDYHAFAKLNEVWNMAIVSDGAGSAKHSDEGSRAVCNVFKFYTEELIKSNDTLKNGEIFDEKTWDIEFRGMLLRFQNELKKQLEQKSVNKEYPFESFAATIILILYSKYGYMVAHVGDGRAGVKINGHWKSVITPHKGEEANQTIFSTAKYFQERPNLKMSNIYVPETHVERQQIEAFVLMSDGCENGAWVTYQRKELSNGDFRVEDVNQPRNNILDNCMALIDVPANDRQHLIIEFITESSKAFQNEPDDKTILIGKTI